MAARRHDSDGLMEETLSSLTLLQDSVRGEGQRPASAQRVEVRVRLNCYDLVEVDVPKHRFVADFFLEASWEDGSLNAADFEQHAEVPEVESSKWGEMFPFQNPSSEQHWTPRLGFVNVIELHNREAWVRVYTRARDREELLPKPVVCYRLRARGVFEERFELQHFPFDSQDLQLTIASMHPVVGSCQIELIANPSPRYQNVVPNESFLLIDEYSMAAKFGVKRDETSPKRSAARLTYPLLTLSLKIKRRPSFYLWTVAFPMFLFVLLAFPCLLLEPGQLVERLGLVYTLMLTAVTYKFYVSEHLPKCSYLTIVDSYILIAISVLVLLSAESVLVFQLSKKKLFDESWSALEDAVGLLLLLLWVAMHAGVLLFADLAGFPTQLEKDAGVRYSEVEGAADRKKQD